LTASHLGFFEFRLCPDTSMETEVNQECLDDNLLTLFHKDTRFNITDSNPRIYEITASLPLGLTCQRCVLQWTYTAGNNWGKCEDGTGRVGCGPQETFRGCADVSIWSTMDKSREAGSIDGDLINSDDESYLIDNEIWWHVTYYSIEPLINLCEVITFQTTSWKLKCQSIPSLKVKVFKPSNQWNSEMSFKNKHETKCDTHENISESCLHSLSSEVHETKSNMVRSKIFANNIWFVCESASQSNFPLMMSEKSLKCKMRKWWQGQRDGMKEKTHQ
jgi:hypothetical protein